MLLPAARITKLNGKFYDDWKSLIEGLDAQVMRSFTNFKATAVSCLAHRHIRRTERLCCRSC